MRNQLFLTVDMFQHTFYVMSMLLTGLIWSCSSDVASTSNLDDGDDSDTTMDDRLNTKAK